MQIDSFIFHLIVAIVPGYITYVVFKHIKIVGKSDAIQKDWLCFLSIFIFSIIDIAILAAWNYFHEYMHSEIHTDVTRKLFDEKQYFTFSELAVLIVIGLFVGLITAQLYNRKIIYKFAKFLNINVSYGEEDVWTMTVGAEEIEWVYIRDHEYEKIYFGHIEKYSDTNTDRELTLSDVSVFDNINGEELYSVPRMYICRDKYKLTVEQVEIKGVEDANKTNTTNPATRRGREKRRIKSFSKQSKTKHKTSATRAKTQKVK